jgi:hypothetical protein
MEAFIISIKILVYPWVVQNAKNMENGNPFAHLLFFLMSGKALDKILYG